MNARHEEVQRIGKELSPVLESLHQIHKTVHNAIKPYIDGFSLKGNETVGWLGEMYAFQLFGGKIEKDRLSYDLTVTDSAGEIERIEVKTRRVTASSNWSKTGVIKLKRIANGSKFSVDVDNNQNPTHLVFVKLYNNYSLAAIYKFSIKKLWEDNRLIESTPGKVFRGYTFTLSENTDIPCAKFENPIVQKIQDNSFDAKLNELAHYKLYPEMRPLVGSYFTRMNKRVLIIGESHYLPKESTIHGNETKDVEQWYKGVSDKLKPKEREWINTRKNSGSITSAKGHTIYRQLRSVLSELVDGDDLPMDNPFRYVAYYNYFQRPAHSKMSVKATKLDETIAYEHLLALIEVLGVTDLAFVSKLAYKSFWKQHGTVKTTIKNIFGSAHPSCSWWNTAHRHKWWGEEYKMTSREWFKKRVGVLSVDSFETVAK
jgi:hypothetical protein